MASSSTTSNPNIKATLHASAMGLTISAYVTYEYIGGGGPYVYADSEFPTPVMSLGSGTTYNDTAFANDVHSGVTLGSHDTTTFTRTVATSGQKTITWTAGRGVRGDFEVSLDKTITIAGPPTGPFISSAIPGTDSVTMTGGVESMGTAGSTPAVELVLLNVPYTTSGIPQLVEAFNTLSATKTVSNNSTPWYGGITISPNTQYYMGVYASNGSADVRYDGGTVVTLAEAATVSVASTTTDSVTINYSTSADGGQYSKSIQYSIDGGTTWVTGATIATGSASAGTYTISNLTASTTYTIQTRVTTTAGSSTGSTLTATTTGAQATLYGSVSGNTKEITELYGPAEIPVYEITALTNNAGFDTDAFIIKWVEEQGYMTDTPERLEIRNDDFDGHHLRVVFTNSAAVYFASWTGTYDGSLSDWGFDDTPVAGVFSYITTPALATKKITKLYGSVNGQTKLIYEAQQ